MRPAQEVDAIKTMALRGLAGLSAINTNDPGYIAVSNEAIQSWCSNHRDIAECNPGSNAEDYAVQRAWCQLKGDFPPKGNGSVCMGTGDIGSLQIAPKWVDGKDEGPLRTWVEMVNDLFEADKAKGFTPPTIAGAASSVEKTNAWMCGVWAGAPGCGSSLPGTTKMPGQPGYQAPKSFLASIGILPIVIAASGALAIVLIVSMKKKPKHVASPAFAPAMAGLGKHRKARKHSRR
jgi:hypothetical protein